MSAGLEMIKIPRRAGGSPRPSYHINKLLSGPIAPFFGDGDPSSTAVPLVIYPLRNGGNFSARE